MMGFIQKRRITAVIAILFGSVFYFLGISDILFEDPAATTRDYDDQSWKSNPDFEILPYTLRIGEELYGKYCQVCHGAAGEGDGFNAYNLSPRPRNFKDREYLTVLSDNRLGEAIREGGRGVNKSVLMPAWGNMFSDLEIEYLVQFVRQFSMEQAE